MILKNGDDKVDDKVDVSGVGSKSKGGGIASALCVVVIIINKGAGKGAVKKKGVTMTIAKGLRIVCHHQGHNSSSRAKMMQIHLLKICTCALLDTLQA